MGTWAETAWLFSLQRHPPRHGSPFPPTLELPPSSVASGRALCRSLGDALFFFLHTTTRGNPRTGWGVAMSPGIERGGVLDSGEQCMVINHENCFPKPDDCEAAANEGYATFGIKGNSRSDGFRWRLVPCRPSLYACKSVQDKAAGVNEVKAREGRRGTRKRERERREL